MLEQNTNKRLKFDWLTFWGLRIFTSVTKSYLLTTVIVVISSTNFAHSGELPKDVMFRCKTIMALRSFKRYSPSFHIYNDSSLHATNFVMAIINSFAHDMKNKHYVDTSITYESVFSCCCWWSWSSFIRFFFSSFHLSMFLAMRISCWLVVCLSGLLLNQLIINNLYNRCNLAHHNGSTDWNE